MDIRKIIKEEVNDFDWVDGVGESLHFPLDVDDLDDLVGHKFRFYRKGELYDNREWTITKVMVDEVQYVKDGDEYTNSSGIENFLNLVNRNMINDNSWSLINPNTNEIYDWYGY